MAATADSKSIQPPTVVKLSGQNNSGESGTAALMQTNGDNDLFVVLRLAGGNAAGPQRAYIHAGSCTHLDPRPTYALENVVDGSSKTTIRHLTLVSLVKGHYAIAVHSSATDLASAVACGNVTWK
jgi:hypothetical protein